MTAQVHDLRIEAGTSHSVQLVARDIGTYETDWSARLQVRRHLGDLLSLVDLTSAEDGGIVFEENFSAVLPDHSTVVGLGVRADFSEAQTAVMTPTATDRRVTLAGKVFYEIGIFDLEVTDSDGTTLRLVQGRVFVSPEVTR